VDGNGYHEVLGDDRKEPVADRLWQALLRRPLALPLLVTVALVIAGIGAAVLTAGGAQVANVTVTETKYTSSEPPWPDQAGGRPPGPVVLSVSATVRRGSSGAPTRVLGITGPAIIGADNPAVLVPRGRPVTVPLRAEVDCPSLPITIPRGAYGLRIQARSGWGTNNDVAEVGAVGEKWSLAIQLACDSWLARRDLTVTTLSARVHPSRPQFNLTLTVTNSGSRPGTLRADTIGGEVSVRVLGAPFTVPARGSVTVTRTVVLGTCDTVGDPRDQPDPSSSEANLTSRVNLVGLAGTVPSVSPAADPEGDSDSFGSTTGIVMATPAAKALTAALSQACARLSPMVSLQSPGTVRYNRARRELTVSVLIYVTPGRVRSIRLNAETGPADVDAYRPLWTTTPAAEPDRSGQLTVTLRYRAPRSGPCPNRGGYLPGFIATLDVPVGRAVRTVSYSGGVDLSQDRKALSLLCSKADLQ
jgi:hypothetical protein